MRAKIIRGNKKLLMKFDELTFSSFPLYEGLIVAVLLWLTFRAINFYLPVVVRKLRVKNWLIRNLPIIELLLWVCFFIWFVQINWAANSVYALGAIVLSIIVFGRALQLVTRDYISGIIFRYSNHFKIDEKIISGDISGKIRRFGKRTLEIENSNGRVLFVPYTQLLTAVNERQHHGKTISGHTFRMKAKKAETFSTLADNIQKSTKNLPWISLRKNAKVVIVEELDNAIIVEITIYAINEKYFMEIENYLRKKFEK